VAQQRRDYTREARRILSMFDRLIRKGGKLAGDYVREQLGQRSQGTGGTGRPEAGGSSSAYAGHRPASQQASFGGNGAGSAHQVAGHGVAAGMSPEDQAAVARYRYMLRTAPPEDMERAHAEAFARLTPQQRALLRNELSQELPAGERPRTDDAGDLARAATRAEISRPGFMEQVLGRTGGRSGRGVAGGLAAGAAGGLGAGLLAGVAGAFIGTAVAGPLLEGFAGMGEEFTGAAEGLADGVTGAGEEVFGAGGEILSAGEGVADQAGGLFDGFLGAGERFLGGDGFFGER
jgi:hypothetical protein